MRIESEFKTVQFLSTEVDLCENQQIIITQTIEQ